ncbi:hypothetical protein [Methylobacterium sp. D54C]
MNGTGDVSEAAASVLQMLYASRRTSIPLDSFALATLGYPYTVQDEAVDELRGIGLVRDVSFRDELALTDTGRVATARMWPRGQMPDATGPRLVIGAFDGQDELPVRLAVPVPDLADVPGDSPFAREIAAQSMRCSVWRLLVPPDNTPETRLLVRLDEGRGTVTEFVHGADTGHGMHVSPGIWLSVDLSGRCREVRSSLEELLFLVAMGAD